MVIPFRNASSTIDAAIAGLTCGIDEALEVLCIDDGSSDAGAERVRGWATRDPRVRLHPQRVAGAWYRRCSSGYPKRAVA